LGPLGERRDGSAGRLEGFLEPQCLERGVRGGADDHHREVACLVQEDQPLVAVEVARVGERAHHGPGPCSGSQSVRAVDVRETAVTVELRLAALRAGPAEPPGSARGVHDEVGLDEGSVDPRADDSSTVEGQSLDVTPAQGEAGRFLRRVSKCSFERRPTRQHPHHLARSGGAWRLHGLGAQVLPAAVSLRPLRLEGHRHLRAEAVCVLELHDPPTDPGISDRSGVPVHRDDPVTATGHGGAEQESGGARTHDECAHGQPFGTLGTT
jgi:hypothetical protein